MSDNNVTRPTHRGSRSGEIPKPAWVGLAQWAMTALVIPAVVFTATLWHEVGLRGAQIEALKADHAALAGTVGHVAAKAQAQREESIRLEAAVGTLSVTVRDLVANLKTSGGRNAR